MTNTKLSVVRAVAGAPNDMVMAGYVGEALHAAYPGWLWAVNVTGRTGMCDILNLSLSGRWGYRLRLPEVYSASSLIEDAKRAAGEILERYNQRRGAFDAAGYMSLKLDACGTPIGDKSH